MNARIKELKEKRRYASILMTYSCTIACRHCCFNCWPRNGRGVVGVEDAVRHLAEFHRMDRAIHIAGGEPFMHYGRLRDIVHAASDAGVPPHFIETNCSWCVSDDLTRERMSDLKDHGVLWMLISADPYHLRHVPVDRVARGIAIAEEIFGPDTTMGKVGVQELERAAAVSADEQKTVHYVREHPPALVGRAARELAQYLEPQPISQFTLETGWGLDPEDTCNREWDPLWEIHVDPYGNVQTNCGVMLGNVHDIPITELMRCWPERNPILKGFSESGVAFLIETAVERGFALEQAYPQKCYLCAAVRTFLRTCDDQFKEVFGPDEVYEA